MKPGLNTPVIAVAMLAALCSCQNRQKSLDVGGAPTSNSGVSAAAGAGGDGSQLGTSQAGGASSASGLYATDPSAGGVTQEQIDAYAQQAYQQGLQAGAQQGQSQSNAVQGQMVQTLQAIQQQALMTMSPQTQAMVQIPQLLQSVTSGTGGPSAMASLAGQMMVLNPQTQNLGFAIQGVMPLAKQMGLFGAPAGAAAAE